jgi:hypothetical protein
MTSFELIDQYIEMQLERQWGDEFVEIRRIVGNISGRWWPKSNPARMVLIEYVCSIWLGGSGACFDL